MPCLYLYRDLHRHFTLLSPPLLVFHRHSLLFLPHFPCISVAFDTLVRVSKPRFDREYSGPPLSPFETHSMVSLGTPKFIRYFSIFLYNQKNYKEKSLIEMVLVVPKAFILNSPLDSKLSDSLFIINPFIMYVISINVKKYQKIPKML